MASDLVDAELGRIGNESETDTSEDNDENAMESEAGHCERTCSCIFWLMFFGAWYGVFITFSVFTLETLEERLLYAIPWNILYTMIFWSFGYSNYYGSKSLPPKNYYVNRKILQLPQLECSEMLARIVEERKLNASYDFVCTGEHCDGVCNRTSSCLLRIVKACVNCGCIKPSRCHHCRQCDRCVLRMDHHCPAVGTCVGYRTYKAFLLFLIYTTLLSVFGFSITLPYLINFWFYRYLNDSDSQVAVYATLSCFLVFSVLLMIPLVMFLSFQLSITSSNRTTLHCLAMDQSDRAWKEPNFDLGVASANFRAVFGDFWPYWFLPFNTMQSDGTNYPQISYWDILQKSTR